MYYKLSNCAIILQTKIAKLILIKPEPPHRYTQIDGVSKKSYEVISKKVYSCVSFLVVSTDFTLRFLANKTLQKDCLQTIYPVEILFRFSYQEVILTPFSHREIFIHVCTHELTYR